MTLDYVKIPVDLYQLKISSLLELSILALALSFSDTGLLLSNKKIAGLFNSNRTSVIRAISRLVEKGYLRRVENKLHRKLIVDSRTLLLCDSIKSPPEVVALQALNSSATATHKLNKVNNSLSCPNSDEFRLAEVLLNQILERKPDFKKPNLQSWSKHIGRMIRLDKRTPERIEAVIRWCQKDTFWQSNILSTEKLREQFDQLEMKMVKQIPVPTTSPPVRDKDGKTEREKMIERTGAII